jgi:hypothetical protein
MRAVASNQELQEPEAEGRNEPDTCQRPARMIDIGFSAIMMGSRYIKVLLTGYIPTILNQVLEATINHQT